MRAKERVQILISLFLLFHLVGVIFEPNLNSYTGEKLSKIYLHYMNGLGLGGIWSFFAPEPVSPPMYIDYNLVIKDDLPVSGRFPDDNEKFFFSAGKNRRISVTRMMMADEKHMEHMFMNYLCNQFKNAVSAKLWAVRGTQPDLNMVREQGKKISKTVDYKSEFVGEYTCKRGESSEGAG